MPTPTDMRPPFTRATTATKARTADDAWNTHHDAGDRRYRARVTALGEVDDTGVVRRREASTDDRPIAAGERRFHGAAPGPRLQDLGFGSAVA